MNKSFAGIQRLALELSSFLESTEIWDEDRFKAYCSQRGIVSHDPSLKSLIKISRIDPIFKNHRPRLSPREVTFLSRMYSNMWLKDRIPGWIRPGNFEVTETNARDVWFLVRGLDPAQEKADILKDAREKRRRKLDKRNRAKTPLFTPTSDTRGMLDNITTVFEQYERMKNESNKQSAYLVSKLSHLERTAEQLLDDIRGTKQEIAVLLNIGEPRPPSETAIVEKDPPPYSDPEPPVLEERPPSPVSKPIGVVNPQTVQGPVVVPQPVEPPPPTSPEEPKEVLAEVVEEAGNIRSWEDIKPRDQIKGTVVINPIVLEKIRNYSFPGTIKRKLAIRILDKIGCRVEQRNNSTNGHVMIQSPKEGQGGCILQSSSKSKMVSWKQLMSRLATGDGMGLKIEFMYVYLREVNKLGADIPLYVPAPPPATEETQKVTAA